jgi:hypothetical protein
MAALGQSRRSDRAPFTSGLPRKADKSRARWHFAFVPFPKVIGRRWHIRLAAACARGKHQLALERHRWCCPRAGPLNATSRVATNAACSSPGDILHRCQDFGTHVLIVLGEDGSEIELDQSECTMRDLSRTAAAHRVVPVG